MAYETRDPYLKQHDARYAPDDRSDTRIPTTRRSASSAVGIAVALILAVAVVSVIALGRTGTTTAPTAPAPDVTIEVPQPAAPGADDPAPGVQTGPEAGTPSPTPAE